MRIISGSLRGLRLPLHKRALIRPTSERVREALFSVLGTVVTGARALDLFAGSGSLGLEALSRGAKGIVLVEKDKRLARNLVEFCRNNNLIDKVEILNMDASQALSVLAGRKDKFEIIFLDPPYDSDLLGRLFSNSSFMNLLSPEGLLIIERSKLNSEMEKFQKVDLEKTFFRNYGSSVVEIFASIRSESKSNLESN
jgi:16S rRNA (guanine966-N2)-methyltransferase